MTKLNLKGQEYSAKLDFKTLANIQLEFKKKKLEITMSEIFEGIAKQDFSIIIELVIQSILRCHPQIKRETLENKLELNEMKNIFDFVAELTTSSMPKTTKEDEEIFNIETKKKIGT